MYKLFRDSGDLSSDLTTEVGDYNGIDTEFTVSELTAGVIYRFNYFALNEFGSSGASPILTIAATTLPDAPTDIAVDWTRSNKTSLFVQWKQPAVEPAALITGYLLQIDDGSGGQFTTVYDGTENTGDLSYLATNLKTGFIYRFRAFAVNFNGQSAPSQVA